MDETIHFYRKGLDLIENKGSNSDLYFRLISNLFKILKSKKMYKDALELLSRPEKSKLKISKRRNIEILANKALIMNLMSNHKEAT